MPNGTTVTTPPNSVALIRKTNFFFMLHITSDQKSDLFHVSLPQGPRLI